MIYRTPKEITPNNGFFNIFGMEDEEISSKNDEYISYIKEHIGNVQSVYNNKRTSIEEYIQANFDKYYSDTISQNLYSLIKNHDTSKVSPEEFIGYRAKFYPTQIEKDLIDKSDSYKQYIENNFNVAWIYHAHTNRHHPEFWITKDYTNNHWEEIYVPMPIVYTIEMLIDWGAMGLKFGGTAAKYYKEHGHEKPLHGETRKLIETLLPIFE